MIVFKISLPGRRVQGAKLEEEVLDNLYPSPKVSTIANPPHAGIIFLNWSSTTLAVPLNTIKTLYSFPHNYGYIPSVFASYHFDNGSNTNNGILPLQTGALGLLNIDADNTNINLKYVSFDLTSTTPVVPFTMQVRFYVFAERGSA